MEIRQYDIYIDGVRLPEYFFPDEDTQLGVRNRFTFRGCVERTGAEHDVFGDLENWWETFDPNIPHFASLLRTISFRLRWSAEQDVGLRICLTGGPIQ